MEPSLCLHFITAGRAFKDRSDKVSVCLTDSSKYPIQRLSFKSPWKTFMCQPLTTPVRLKNSIAKHCARNARIVLKMNV